MDLAELARMGEQLGGALGLDPGAVAELFDRATQPPAAPPVVDGAELLAAEVAAMRAELAQLRAELAPLLAVVGPLLQAPKIKQALAARALAANIK